MDLVVGLFEQYALNAYLYRPWAASLRAASGANGTQLSGWLDPARLEDAQWLPRQALSIFLSLSVLGFLLYMVVASLSYLLFFVVWRDKYHPSSLPQPRDGQVGRELLLALWSVPVMGVLTTPVVLLEFYGYAKLYDRVDEYGWGYLVLSAALFLAFTDTTIYWIHRWEHEVPFLYRYVHKPHHEWIVPTSYAALAFHPVDGWLQSLPYHIFTFIFPFHKVLYLVMFVFVQVWTISIHDGVDFAPWSFINGAVRGHRPHRERERQTHAHSHTRTS
jgi:Delta7-sterol 5-desaturase